MVPNTTTGRREGSKELLNHTLQHLNTNIRKPLFMMNHSGPSFTLPQLFTHILAGTVSSVYQNTLY